jgi:hypothetical protein
MNQNGFTFPHLHTVKHLDRCLADQCKGGSFDVTHACRFG